MKKFEIQNINNALVSKNREEGEFEKSKEQKRRKEIAIKIDNLIHTWLYFIEDPKDEKIIVRFWQFLDKYVK